MDFLWYFGWGIFPQSNVLQTVIFDWAQLVIDHCMLDVVMTNCVELPFLELSVIPFSDGEQYFGDGLYLNTYGFQHRGRVRQFSLIELNFIAFKLLHVVLLQKIGFENL